MKKTNPITISKASILYNEIKNLLQQIFVLAVRLNQLEEQQA